MTELKRKVRISKGKKKTLVVDGRYKRKPYENLKLLEEAEGMKELAISNINKDLPSCWREKNQESAQVIVQALAEGMSTKAARSLIGLTDKEWANWLSNDKDFHGEVERAIRLYEQTMLDVIRDASKVDWKAASWLLEHHSDIKGEYVESKNGGQQMVISLNFERQPLEAINDEGIIINGVPVVDSKFIPENRAKNDNGKKMVKDPSSGRFVKMRREENDHGE